MVITDSPASGTGFSEQMRHITFRLAQSGHEISWLGLQTMGFPVQYTDYMFTDLPHKGAKVRVLGTWGDPSHFGADIFVKHYKEFTPDLVMFMGDPHNIQHYAKWKKTFGFPMLMYTTLDGLPIHPNMVKYLKIPNIIVSMTNWAAREYDKVGIKSCCVPHGINWSWWQTTKEAKSAVKKQLGLDEDTVVVANWDTNQYRKRQDSLLRCWKAINPEYRNVKLLLYTDWNSRLGWDIEKLIEQYDVPRDTILSPKDLTGEHKAWENPDTPDKLKQIVQIGDIYATATSGEGFGVCMAEAQALGMPVIAPNYSSVPEVVRTGIHVPLYTGQRGKWRWHDNCRSVEGGVVNEDRFAEHLNRLIDNKNVRDKMGVKAKEQIQVFDLDSNVIKLWQSVLSQIDPDKILALEVLEDA